MTILNNKHSGHHLNPHTIFESQKERKKRDEGMCGKKQDQKGLLSHFKPNLLASTDPERGAIV